jgi:hypothetical protein
LPQWIVFKARDESEHLVTWSIYVDAGLNSKHDSIPPFCSCLFTFTRTTPIPLMQEPKRTVDPPQLPGQSASADQPEAAHSQYVLSTSYNFSID